LTSVLGQRRHAFWHEHGFLVLSGFFTEEEVAAVERAEAVAWEDRRPDVIVDDLVTNRRSRISDVAEEDRTHPFKVNDLYLIDERLRNVAVSERVGMVLAELLGDEPVLCNTLSFEKGSQQADHLDTLYMTPRTDGALAATWIALEDTHSDAGPLRYYPGSNHIAPFRFSDGTYHVNLPEMPQWSEYMAGEVDRHGLQEERFLAQRGDLFIWDAWLLHGGSEICDVSRTRRSLVSHYFTQTDCEHLGSDLRPGAGAWWMHKPPLTVPEDEAAAPTEGVLERTEPAAPLGVAAGRPLFERMRTLLTARD